MRVLRRGGGGRVAVAERRERGDSEVKRRDRRAEERPMELIELDCSERRARSGAYNLERSGWRGVTNKG